MFYAVTFESPDTTTDCLIQLSRELFEDSGVDVGGYLWMRYREHADPTKRGRYTDGTPISGFAHGPDPVPTATTHPESYVVTFQSPDGTGVKLEFNRDLWHDPGMDMGAYLMTQYRAAVAKLGKG
jgi:hypothetical protein